MQLKKNFEYITLRFLRLKSRSNFAFFIYILFSVFVFEESESALETSNIKTDNKKYMKKAKVDLLFEEINFNPIFSKFF